MENKNMQVIENYEEFSIWLKRNILIKVFSALYFVFEFDRTF